MLDPYYIVVAIVFFVMLTVLVAAHEFGHYLFARMFGMEVEAFALMLGGVRKTDLSHHLRKPLLSGWVVAASAAALIIAWDAMVRLQAPLGALIPVQILAVVGVPLWIASRIAALYHARFLNVCKWIAICSVGWIFVLNMFGALQSVGPSAYVPLLAPITVLGVIFTYYMPVAKREEEEDYGNGQIVLENGEVAPLRFRPVWCTERNGTEFALLVLPFGGFAKIKGMQPREDASETTIAGGFFSKPPWQRFMVLLAGPLFSVLAGMILFFGIFSTAGIPEPDVRPVLGKVLSKSPADLAGLKEGDVILSADGTAISTFQELRTYIAGRPNKPVALSYRRGDRVANISVTPVETKEPEPVLDSKGKETGAKARLGKLGILSASVRKPASVGEAASTAFLLPFRAVSHIVGQFSRPAELQDEVGGIASVAAATDAASRQGIPDVLELAAGLSISLGIFNLLPIYPLDGGQMMVALLEMFRRGRRLSIKVQNAISSVGLAMILMLVVFVLVNDTKKLSGAKDPLLPPVKEQKK